MKKSTINKVIDELNNIKNMGLTIDAYIDKVSIYSKISNIRKFVDSNPNSEDKEIALQAIQLYNSLKKNKSTEEVDTDDKAVTEVVRDEDGKIVSYKFTIFRRDREPIIGTFSRDEMNQIYRMYSYYGSSLTQRIVSRNFPEYSLVDFKRILRAFNITKASAPFAPHMFEEYTEDQLKEIHLREKENDFLRRIEKDKIKDQEQLLTKQAKEILSLRNNVDIISNLNLDITNIPNVQYSKTKGINNLILHLADMHIGAKVESGSLYPNTWNKEELYKRLTNLVKKISTLGDINTIVLNLLGDSVDGMDGMTARRDHIMPQNMDNKEQITLFIESMVWFTNQLKSLCNKLMVYSVPSGNHGGDFEYVANLALKSILEGNNIQFKLFDTFIGNYDFNGETYLIMHGKDPKFMKKPLPLNLNDQTEVFMRNWMDRNNINNDGHIHIIKGDLHSNALNANIKYTYRNVLSLFGDSDYSQMNYPSNGYGVSYDLYIGNNLVLGTFENL